MIKKNDFLSIVIPTYNAGRDFRSLLCQLRKQYHFANSEIIVVDSSSTDGTPECAKSFNARVISISQSEFNHGATRNLGIEECNGELVCLFTQDALPVDDKYLFSLVETLEREDAAGGFARQIPKDNATPLVKRDVQRWIAGSDQPRTMHIDSPNHFFSASPMERYLTCVFDNVSSIIRKEAWDKIPFPHAPFGEDVEWAYRALCNGYKLIYEPKSVVQHSHQRSAQYTYKRTFVDHYRLNQLFGLRTIPSRRKALRSFMISSCKDWLYLAQNPQWDSDWLKSACSIPFHAWSSAWGQYNGAKAAACGAPIYQSRDV
jgi:GT2 family glycosyltransferase